MLFFWVVTSRRLARNTGVSDKHIVSIFRASGLEMKTVYFCMCILNVGMCLRVYTASQARTTTYFSPPTESKISLLQAHADVVRSKVPKE
jgi:hypothetical protein